MGYRSAAIALLFATLCAACDDVQQAPPLYPSNPQYAGDDPNAAQGGDNVPIGVQGDAYADTDPSALTDFHGALDPHGTWVDDPTYGSVWVPNPGEVGPDFTPYVSSGHWVYGDDYVWVSDYEWGWAPYHYGRWVAVDGRGWVWIPGRAYSGAWVEWRTGADGFGYVGWAPLPPRFVWRGGYAVGYEMAPPPRFVFVAREDVFVPGVGGRIVGGDRAAFMEGHTSVYMAASPVAGGHPFAQSAMHGPPPSSFGIDPSHVPHPSEGERGLSRAQQFSRPSTAQSLGARPATSHTVRTAPRRPQTYSTQPSNPGRSRPGRRR